MQRAIAVVVVSLLAVYPAGCSNTRLSRAPVASQSPSKVPVQSKPREVQSSGLEKFKGGAGVVTVLLIVVLVIVILILLKKI